MIDCVVSARVERFNTNMRWFLQGVSILKDSLQSKTMLTDVFHGNNERTLGSAWSSAGGAAEIDIIAI